MGRAQPFELEALRFKFIESSRLKNFDLWNSQKNNIDSKNINSKTHKLFLFTQGKLVNNAAFNRKKFFEIIKTSFCQDKYQINKNKINALIEIFVKCSW